MMESSKSSSSRIIEKEKNEMHSQSKQQRQQQQKHHHQYSGWFHPHKSWKCILVELLLSWLMQLDKLAAKCQKIKSLEQQQQAQASSTSEAAASETNNNSNSSGSGSSNSSELSAMELMTQENLKVRNRFGSGDDSMVEKALKKWENVAGCPIRDESVYIPRCNNLLQAWGLVVNDEGITCSEASELEHLMPTSDILVKVRFPSNLLPVVDSTNETTGKDVTTTSSSSPFNLHHHLLENNPNVPVVLHFHGGGLTLGNTNDVVGIDLVRGVVQVAQQQQQQQDALIKTLTTNDANSATTTTTNDSNLAIILVDVEYSLAPEHAFPVAIVEALTVLQYLLQGDDKNHNRNRKIHISGVSAGGLLAAVATLQGMRRFPGQVASSTLLCPMLDPSCDSNSYRQNATASWLVPTTWLQWCWQVYLYQKNQSCYSRSNNKSKDKERKEDDDDDEIIEPIPNLECTNSSSSDTSDTTTDVDSSLDEKSHDSSHDDENVAVSSLSTSKQEESSLQSSQQQQPWWQQYRDGSKLVPGLMSPLWDNFDDVKDNNDNLPHFLISTNRGDPLHDEGVELVQKLQAGLVGCKDDDVFDDSSERTVVQHLDHDGTHWFGTAIDSRQYEELIHAMKDLIFAATDDAALSSDGACRLRN